MKRKAKNSNRNIERNIEARSDGYSFRVRMKINGIFINETFFSLDEARAYRDLLRAGKSTDILQEKVLRAKLEKKKNLGLTIGILLSRYSEEVSIHKKGYKHETYTIGKLQRIKFFSEAPIYLVDGNLVERLKIELGKTLTSTTVRKYLMLISHLFKMAVAKRWCTDLNNPIKTVELPKPSRMRCRRIEPEEHEFLVAELRKARNPLILPFFEFLIETACRRGEALRLAVKDVDLEGRTALLRDTKNGDDRLIGISSKALSILVPLVESAQSSKPRSSMGAANEKIFPLKPGAIRSAFDHAKVRARKAYFADCKNKGKEPKYSFCLDLRLHDSRREATSLMFEKGLDIMEVSSMTGHKTLSMLRGYTHLRAKDLALKLG